MKRFLSKYWPVITAWVVIVGSVLTVAGVVITDSKSDPVPVTRPLAVASSPVAKASSTAPVQPPRVNNSIQPNDYTKLDGNTITYIVTGSSAHISYGSPDNNESATSPLNKTESIKGTYYSIVIRMDDGGDRTKLVVKINGKTVAKTFATADQPLASIAVTKEYGSKNWVAIPSTAS